MCIGMAGGPLREVIAYAQTRGVILPEWHLHASRHIHIAHRLRAERSKYGLEEYLETKALIGYNS